MSDHIDVQARNMRLTDNTREYVEKKAAKLERLLQEIEEIRIELTHEKNARQATDRQVAQMTLRGKGFTLRTEERSDDLHAAFDAALDKMQRQVERYKGKHFRGRGDGRSAAEVTEEESWPVDETGELLPLIAKRKKFIIMPMNEDEAVEQMRLLGHNNFFIFFNAEQNAIQVLYRRRNGSYGLIEPVVG
ncbi:MAG: ribosome-associated translation inhibitor RaiA [Anaerolineae bacterium]|nr:Ribosome hibernation promotion factor [Anaerolineales bacterium]RIK29956.1 MAG: ribosome-associated translation inhibitor RaiA [Anaerolineae bacterium]WKZ45771.1 MAG: ribosome-associated translation inhibitor RaiA [Anaerolineales bacterium]WKZ48418.1 MAG: ribosome-associated translation inhibitor RaiA [Anaerolineales bacterium]